MKYLITWLTFSNKKPFRTKEKQQKAWKVHFLPFKCKTLLKDVFIYRYISYIYIVYLVLGFHISERSIAVTKKGQLKYISKPVSFLRSKSAKSNSIWKWLAVVESLKHVGRGTLCCLYSDMIWALDEQMKNELPREE